MTQSNAGATAAHRPSNRAEGSDLVAPTPAPRPLAILPRLVSAGPGARPILVPRFRPRRVVPEPRPPSRVRVALGRVLDRSRSARGPWAIPQNASMGHRRHADVPVPRRTRGVHRLRSGPDDRTVAR